MTYIPYLGTFFSHGTPVWPCGPTTSWPPRICFFLAHISPAVTAEPRLPQTDYRCWNGVDPPATRGRIHRLWSPHSFRARLHPPGHLFAAHLPCACWRLRRGPVWAHEQRGVPRALRDGAMATQRRLRTPRKSRQTQNDLLGRSDSSPIPEVEHNNHNKKALPTT